MRYTLFLLLLFVFSACNKHISEISIYSNLQEGDSISVALYSKIEDRYTTVNGATVTSKDIANGRVDISLPDTLIRNIPALAFTIHTCSDTILAISSIRLGDYVTFYPQDIMRTLWWQYGLMFEIDSKSNTIKSRVRKDIPGGFPVGIEAMYHHRPIGFQLFFRIFLIVALLILVFILYKQASTQRLLLFTIALFLASLPLKIDYTNYVMGAMIIAMLIAFIYNKSRRFVWHPIFYVLCAMYLMNVIGLIYTEDLKMGLRRLDTNITLIFFPVIFSMTQVSQKNVRLILRFFMWSVMAFCAFGLLSYAAFVKEFTYDMIFTESKIYAPLMMMWPVHPHPSYLSTIVLMAVPVALFLRFQNEKHITVPEMLLGILLPIIFTVLTGARVGIVLTPVLLGLGYLFYCRFKPLVKYGLVVLGIAVVGLLVFKYPNTDERFSDPIRVDLRRTAISAIKEKPVFGWGTGYVLPLIQSEERAHSLGIETPYDLNSLHNQYLEEMTQFGIPGILILLTLFGWMLWLGLRQTDYLLLSLLVIYMVFCCTETALSIAKGVVTFSFWISFLLTNSPATKLSDNNMCNKSNTNFII